MGMGQQQKTRGFAQPLTAKELREAFNGFAEFVYSMRDYDLQLTANSLKADSISYPITNIAGYLLSQALCNGADFIPNDDDVQIELRSGSVWLLATCESHWGKFLVCVQPTGFAIYEANDDLEPDGEAIYVCNDLFNPNEGWATSPLLERMTSPYFAKAIIPQRFLQ